MTAWEIETGGVIPTTFNVEVDNGVVAVEIFGAAPVFVNGTLVYTNKVFVYGTLMPNMERWDGFMDILAVAAEPAEAPGQLFDTGAGYPVAAFDTDDEGRIPGWVVTLEPDLIDHAITLLDQIEHTADGLYRRIPLHVGGHPCWAYHWPWSTANFDRINKWEKREKKEDEELTA